MTPVPSLGYISFTKFTSPEATVEVLKKVVPGQTTAAEIEAALETAGQPAPLWNDLLSYEPPPVDGKTAAGAQVAVDNELLLAAREDRDDRYLLLWIALNLADPRLDAIVREVVMGNDGRLDPSAINARTLRQLLAARNAASIEELPHDAKVTSNILSLLERCRLIVPEKQGGSIVAIERSLPTRHAVPGAVRLVVARFADRGFSPVSGHEIDFALGIGTNAWLNLSEDEFRNAHERADQTVETRQQIKRASLPKDLKELATQLRRRRQVVLQGPPGAGKTFAARRYVQWATAGRVDDSRLQSVVEGLPVNERNVHGIASEVKRRGLTGLWEIVQFHPGYDYTDFVRALAAQSHGEGVTFVAQHRILSLISAVGVELIDRGYEVELVLILDEINRGDIANIFGELLYALEYRGEAVATPYAVEGNTSLIIPANLHVLGTMNTADRSIAVIDYALRRRFVFLTVSASDQPIRGFDFDDEVTSQAALYLYERVGEALSNAPPGLQVGPSYFLVSTDGEDPSLTVLAGRFVYEVLPLLAEYGMEGEIDPGVLIALRRTLEFSETAAQEAQVVEVLKHLATQPWHVPTRAALDSASGEE